MISAEDAIDLCEARAWRLFMEYIDKVNEDPEWFGSPRQTLRSLAEDLAEEFEEQRRELELG